MEFLWYYLLAINILAFSLMGEDKRRARRQGARRIRERTLLLLAAAGGSVGAIFGMRLFHHKALHGKFRYGLPVILLLQLAVTAAVLLF